MLGEPALVEANPAGNAQREALLPKQRVPAVAAPEAEDGALVRQVRDEHFFRVARPVVHNLPWNTKVNFFYVCTCVASSETLFQCATEE